MREDKMKDIKSMLSEDLGMPIEEPILNDYEKTVKEFKEAYDRGDLETCGHLVTTFNFRNLNFLFDRSEDQQVREKNLAREMKQNEFFKRFAVNYHRGVNKAVHTIFKEVRVAEKFSDPKQSGNVSGKLMGFLNSNSTFRKKLPEIFANA